MITGVLYLSGNASRLERDVKTILYGRGRQHRARAVAVSAKDRLVKIALLDIRGQAGAWSAALNVDNEERNFRHRRPADSFALQRNPRTGTAGDCEMAGVGETEGERNCAKLVFCLNENSSIFREARFARSP